MTRNTTIIKTPIGKLTISEHNGFITLCEFTNKATCVNKTSSVLAAATDQLSDYFKGHRIKFDLPLATTGTPFQKMVWRVLQSIPCGETWSYQELAKKVGNAKAARAVGTANAKNKICIFIPCHRVILATGKVGNYSGGKVRKIKLLDLEQQALTNNYLG
ncbi:MAG: methylated-DNA--[protein]-cysteine S-methyltransferase [Thiohalomonadales bacterium]